LVYHKIEKHRRTAFPFASLILTLIAVAIASRKVKGGIGIHLGIGILIAFTYLLFMQVSITFATNSNLAPALAVWIPNLCYMVLAGILLYKAPK
ncbi:MAG: LptF/LptG family permease, partial [Bacteroidetes bacterium]|nr:LptF/LptG family permease [Bacteroidota bacterium]